MASVGHAASLVVFLAVLLSCLVLPCDGVRLVGEFQSSIRPFSESPSSNKTLHRVDRRGRWRGSLANPFDNLVEEKARTTAKVVPVYLPGHGVVWTEHGSLFGKPQSHDYSYLFGDPDSSDSDDSSEEDDDLPRDDVRRLAAIPEEHALEGGSLLQGFSGNAQERRVRRWIFRVVAASSALSYAAGFLEPVRRGWQSLDRVVAKAAGAKIGEAIQLSKEKLEPVGKHVIDRLAPVGAQASEKLRQVGERVRSSQVFLRLKSARDGISRMFEPALPEAVLLPIPSEAGSEEIDRWKTMGMASHRVAGDAFAFGDRRRSDKKGVRQPEEISPPETVPTWRHQSHGQSFKMQPTCYEHGECFVVVEEELGMSEGNDADASPGCSMPPAGAQGDGPELEVVQVQIDDANRKVPVPARESDNAGDYDGASAAKRAAPEPRRFFEDWPTEFKVSIKSDDHAYGGIYTYYDHKHFHIDGLPVYYKLGERERCAKLWSGSDSEWCQPVMWMFFFEGSWRILEDPRRVSEDEAIADLNELAADFWDGDTYWDRFVPAFESQPTQDELARPDAVKWVGNIKVEDAQSKKGASMMQTGSALADHEHPVRSEVREVLPLKLLQFCIV